MRAQARCIFPRLHLIQLGIGEAIGFQIGKPVPGFTISGHGRNRRAIGFDGIPGSPHRLERMGATGQCARIIGQSSEHLVEAGQRRIIVADGQRLDRIARQEDRIVRVTAQQRLGLGQRGLVFLAFAQHLDQVESHGNIIGFELGRALQQKFGIVQHAETLADLGQYPHPLDVTRMFLQEAARQGLGLVHPVFIKVVGGSEQGFGQAPESVGLSPALPRFGNVSSLLEQTGQRVPGRKQCRIGHHGGAVRGNRRLIVTLSPLQMSFFLERASEIGRQTFQNGQGVTGLVRLAGKAQGHGLHVTGINMVRFSRQHRVEARDGGVYLPSIDVRLGRSEGIGHVCFDHAALRSWLKRHEMRPAGGRDAFPV